MEDSWDGEEWWFVRKFRNLVMFVDGKEALYRANMKKGRRDIDKMIKAQKKGTLPLGATPSEGFDFAKKGISLRGTKITCEWCKKLSACRTTYHYEDKDRCLWSCCGAKTQDHPEPHLKNKDA